MISLCFLHMIGLKGIWRMWWSRRGRCKRRKCYWTDEAFGKLPCFVVWSKTKLFYLTPQIRNDFLHDVSKEVIALIKIEAEATKFYAIIADTTMNISKMNQFSLTPYLLYVQDSSECQTCLFQFRCSVSWIKSQVSNAMFVHHCAHKLKIDLIMQWGINTYNIYYICFVVTHTVPRIFPMSHSEA